MARFPRVNIEGALYYITSRGDQKAKIFLDDKDYVYYTGLVKKYKSQFKFKLFAYALLPDHFHLLLELSRHFTISQIMHSLNSNYTKHFNSSHNRQGHLFQQRYKMAVVEKNAYLLPIVTYIHENPKALGLVEDSKDYPYSSIHCYSKSNKPKDYLPDMARDVSEALALPTIEKMPDMEKLARDLAKKPVLGSKEFIHKVSMRLKMRPSRMKLVFIIAGVIFVFLAVNLYIYNRSQARESELKSSLKERETEFSRQTQEYYQEQTDSYYKDVSKSLQIEKQKTKALEKQLTKEAQDEN